MGPTKQARKDQIIACASALFAEKGYRQTDLQEVADILGIGKGTIYRNFPNKKELFLSVVSDWNEKLIEKLNRVDEGSNNLLEILAKGISTCLSFFDEHPIYAELILQERVEFKKQEKLSNFEYLDQSIVKWEKFFEELFRYNKTPSVLSPRSVTVILSNLFFGTMFTNLFRGRQQSLEDEIQEMFHFILSSIAGIAFFHAISATNPNADFDFFSEGDDPLLHGEEGWRSFPPRPLLGKGRPFLANESDSETIRFRFFLRESTPHFVGKVWFGPHSEGLTSFVHNGCIASIFEEAMEMTCFLNKHVIVLEKLETEYKQRIPLEKVVLLEAWVEKVEEQNVFTRARLFSDDGVEYSSASGRYYLSDTGSVEHILSAMFESLAQNES